jgi:hypothetical protein
MDSPTPDDLVQKRFFPFSGRNRMNQKDNLKLTLRHPTQAILQVNSFTCLADPGIETEQFGKTSRGGHGCRSK